MQILHYVIPPSHRLRTKKAIPSNYENMATVRIERISYPSHRPAEDHRVTSKHPTCTAISLVTWENPTIRLSGRRRSFDSDLAKSGYFIVSAKYPWVLQTNCGTLQLMRQTPETFAVKDASPPPSYRPYKQSASHRSASPLLPSSALAELPPFKLTNRRTYRRSLLHEPIAPQQPSVLFRHLLSIKDFLVDDDFTILQLAYAGGRAVIGYPGALGFEAGPDILAA
jgi:hypothetical protein